MKYEDWKHLATVCSVLGGLLLLGAYVTYMFPKTYRFYEYSITKYPYRDYTIPLFAFAVVFLVIGIVTLVEQKKKRNKMNTCTVGFLSSRLILTSCSFFIL